jgi:heptaprenyl diphosphate synthase
MSMLLGISLIIFILESYIPPLAPIPGIKLGLANIINLIALYALGRKESFVILVLRIVLGSIFSGNFVGFLYSIAGGLLSFVVIAVLSLFLKEDKMWPVSIFSAIAHNAGQIVTAILILKSPYLIWYFPLLTISAVITGLFTGITAQITLKRLRKTLFKEKNDA